jgi:protein TonB
MQAILPRGLFPEGLSKEKAASLTASIVVNLAMIVAFASIANIDGTKIKEGASLVVIGLSGSASESDQAEAKQAASLPAPPPPAAVPSSATPDFAKREEPIEQKIALLQPAEAPAERTDGAPSKAQADTLPSPDQLREAAEQQRRAQEAARARAEEQAQAEARTKAAASEKAAVGSSGARSGGAGGYGAQIIQHLRRFTRGNSVGAGATLVRIAIDGTGGLQDAAVIRSSGSPSFDREALQTVRRAAPFPKPPGNAARTINFEFTGR